MSKTCKCKTNKGVRCTRVVKDKGMCWQHLKVCKNGSVSLKKTLPKSKVVTSYKKKTFEDITFKVPDDFGTINIYVDLRKRSEDLTKIINPNDIVIKTSTDIKLALNDGKRYEILKLKPATSKGFTRLDMAKASYKMFNTMYPNNSYGDHYLLWKISLENDLYSIHLD
jgi:hypothetical protein